MVAGPVAKAAFQGLEHALPGGAPLLPRARQRALRRERLVLVIRVVRRDPGTRETDLEIGERLVNQRPDRGVETHARAVLGPGWRPTGVKADVSEQAARSGGDLAGVRGIEIAGWLIGE